MDDEWLETDLCECGECICADCDYEVNVSMFLFDVMEKVVARYRGATGRLGARVLALSKARSPQTQARAAVAFDMLWPEGES